MFDFIRIINDDSVMRSRVLRVSPPHVVIIAEEYVAFLQWKTRRFPVYVSGNVGKRSNRNVIEECQLIRVSGE